MNTPQTKTKAELLYNSLRKQKFLRAFTVPDNGGFNPEKFLCVGQANKLKRTNNVKRLTELGYKTQTIDCPYSDNIFHRFALLIEL